MKEKQHRPLVAAMKATVPVMAGHAPLAMVFGLAMGQEGHSWYISPIMSLLVFGGSLQFLAFSMLTAGASLVALLLAALPLAIRNSFYGILMIDRLKGPLWRRLYMAFGLVDSTFSVLTCPSAFEGRAGDQYAFYVTVLNHLYWVAGTLLGSLVYLILPMRLPGLEFSLTALFTALAVENYLKTREVRPYLIAGVAVIASLLISPAHVLLIGICASLVIFLTGEVRRWSMR